MMDPCSTLTIETLTYDRVAKTIDHSLLRPELTLDEIREGCELAARYDVASVCARPAGRGAGAEHPDRDPRRGRDGHRLPARREPHRDQGRSRPSARSPTARPSSTWSSTSAGSGRAPTIGSRPTSGPWSRPRIAGGAIVKVILENAYLTKDEIVRGCQAVERAGGDYVKTSTGFAPSGATLEDLG